MFREIMDIQSQLRGNYILGKAATLNGSIGDVMISNTVMDVHSQNTYWLDNAFRAHDIQPYLIYGSVLDNQKAVSAKGTYLENRQYLDFFYQANYTVVEMESGPYLNAIYEDQYLTRYPVGENINFTGPRSWITTRKEQRLPHPFYRKFQSLSSSRLFLGPVLGANLLITLQPRLQLKL